MSSPLGRKSGDWERRISLQTVLAPKSPRYRDKSGFQAENPCRIWSGTLIKWRILSGSIVTGLWWFTLFKSTWRSTAKTRGGRRVRDTAGQHNFRALLTCKASHPVDSGPSWEAKVFTREPSHCESGSKPGLQQRRPARPAQPAVLSLGPAPLFLQSRPRFSQKQVFSCPVDRSTSANYHVSITKKPGHPCETECGSNPQHKYSEATCMQFLRGPRHNLSSPAQQAALGHSVQEQVHLFQPFSSCLLLCYNRTSRYNSNSSEWQLSSLPLHGNSDCFHHPTNQRKTLKSLGELTSGAWQGRRRQTRKLHPVPNKADG